MKKITLLATLLGVSILALGQASDKPLIKKIEVKGTAEKEVVPDEIYVHIALKEYKKDNQKVNMDQLESQLVKAVGQLNLPKENLAIDNIYGYNWDWRKKKSDDFLATKSFRLKVSDVKMINNLVEKLDAQGVNSMGIAEVTHSRIDEIKNELKLEALKSAKQKAGYLLAGIGEELGSALEIHETDFGDPRPMYERANMMQARGPESDGGYQSDLEFKTIKLKSEIRAVFEID